MNKIIRSVLLISIFIVFQSQSPSATILAQFEDRWLSDAPGYARAVELQRELKVPLVVYFYTDWCPYCRALSNQYFPTAPVQQYLSGVIKVRINPEHGTPERELATRYGVTGYPGFFVIRNPASSPTELNPFRRSGANVTPAQFAKECQRVAPISRQTARTVDSKVNDTLTVQAVGNATRQTTSARIEEVASKLSAPVKVYNNDTVDSVLKRYEKAIGGRDAFGPLTSRVSKGRLDVLGKSYGGRVEFYAKAPNKSLTVMNAEPFGLFKRGFDGRTGWNVSASLGFQNLAGAELAALAVEADFYREVRLRELYPQIRLVGLVTQNYHDVYKIEATPRSGVAEYLYFDVQSGLLTRRDVTRQTSQGPALAEFYFSDWRVVDGVKIPFKTTELLPNAKYVFTMEEVKHNVALDETLFRPPTR